jgi:hypothetical protein
MTPRVLGVLRLGRAYILSSVFPALLISSSVFGHVVPAANLPRIALVGMETRCRQCCSKLSPTASMLARHGTTFAYRKVIFGGSSSSDQHV